MAHGNPHGQHAPGESHTAVPLDPEHDINARSVTIWFIFGSLAVFACLWIMVPIFMRVLEAERHTKVDKAPTQELHDVNDAEIKFLNGGNPTKKTIQSVVDSLRK